MSNKKQIKVIAWKNQPTRLPIGTSIIAYLLMDKINAPQWAWGAVCCVFFLLWIVAIIQIVSQTHVDIFEGKQ